MTDDNLDDPVRKTQWFASFEYLQKQIHQNARDKGFWAPHLQDMLAKLMLVVTELGEAAEAWRAHNLQSKKIPTHSCVEEELADAIIRIMDLAEFYRLDLAGAIVQKMEHNKDRPQIHGKIA